MNRAPARPAEVAPADVVVIGGGAVGVCVARAATAAGGRVALVTDSIRPGGGARLVADGGVLLECANRGLDWHATLAHLKSVRRAVEDRSRDAALRLEGIEPLYGRATLLGPDKIAISGLGAAAVDRTPVLMAARRIVLATGDEPVIPGLTGIDETHYLTAATLLGLSTLPASMIVVGGGPQGCELAQAMARFGVVVTLVEAAERLLPGEHPEVSALITRALRDDGVRVFTGSPAVTLAPTLDGGTWVGTGAGDLAAEGLLLATGRRAAVRGLDLSAAGVELTPDGWVRVDERLATTAHGVLAAGHVTGLLPPGAGDPVMARVAGTNAASRRPRATWTSVELPRVVRTYPPYATVGIGPDAAGSVPGARISDLPLRQLDQALLTDCPAGLVTLVAGPRQPPRGPAGLPGRGEPVSRLLGASIVGPGAGELADLVALALRAGLSVEQLAEAPMSSRTWGSALQHAAASLLGD